MRLRRTGALAVDNSELPTAHPFDHKLHSHLLCSMKRSQKPENHNPKLQSMRATPAPVTFTGMPGHDAGIAGHDHRNTQRMPEAAEILATAPRHLNPTRSSIC